jgi:hypothetical protein
MAGTLGGHCGALAAMLLACAFAAGAAAQTAGAGITIDPEFRLLQPPQRQDLDLAPGPLVLPPALAEGQPSWQLPNVSLGRQIPGEPRGVTASDLFGDGHSIIYGGDVMEDPMRDRRIGGSATIPF